VEGTGYTVASEPFEVTAASLDATTSTNGDVVDLDVAYLAPGGFRLLDLQVDSNGRVPLRSETLAAEVRLGNGDSEMLSVALTDGLGQLTLPSGGSPIQDVVLTDRFGNTTTFVP